jgi:hypothetical protein
LSTGELMSQGSENFERHPLTLSAADAAALDALLETRARKGLRIAGAELAVDGEREVRVQGWLNVVGACAVPAAPGNLLERTLAAVGEDRMKLQPVLKGNGMPASHAEERPVRRRSHLSEVAAVLVAATLLVAVVIPAVGQARQSYRRTLCATNMAGLATGFGAYATDFGKELPNLGVPANHNWLRPDAGGHTNTANLLPLLNAKYVTPARLVCAGKGLDQNAVATATATDISNCSYSYVNLFGSQRPTWNGNGKTIVLSDRNPLFVKPAANTPDDNSFNHGQKGTYLLRADGSVTWEMSPTFGTGSARDNIWTVGLGTERVVFYTGTEVAAGGDVFLAP